ncbi:MAG: HYR domain-containing protein, partial [Flavobacteriales bacterium]
MLLFGQPLAASLSKHRPLRLAPGLALVMFTGSALLSVPAALGQCGDTTAPVVVSGATSITFDCDAGNQADVDNVITAWLNTQGYTGYATDDTDTSLDWTHDYTGLSDDCGATGSATVTFTATDDCGNTATTVATVNVVDETAPTFNEALPADATVECDAVPVAETLTASDECGTAAVTYAQTTTAGSCTGDYTLTRTWTATDECGNTTVHTQTLTVVDTTAPTAVAQNITVQLDASGNVSISTAQINNGSTDNCGTLSFSLDVSSFDCTDVATSPNPVVLTVTDDCGNWSTANATVTVQDVTAPTAVAQNITIQLDSDGNATTTAAAVDNGSSDACGVTLGLSKTAFDCTDLGDNTVTLTVTDPSNNQTTTTATVTVEDNVDPVITLAAANSTVECDGAGNSAAFTAWLNNHGGATATDACGDLTWTHNSTGLSDLCGATGAETVTFRVTDDSGNFAETTATFTISDTTPPTAAANNFTVQLDASGNASITTTNINNASSDICGTVTLSLDVTAFDCSDVGSNPVVLTVTDDCGNSSTANATVTVQDLLSPTITAPADVSVSTDSGICTASGVSLGSATAADNCSYTVANDAPANFPLGNTTVTWTVTDASGNTATDTQVVTVTDDEKPAIANTPTNITQNVDAGLCTADVSWTDATATDNCSLVSFVQSHNSGDTFALGTTTVTYTATDATGNIQTSSFTVTVVDNEAPTITAMADIPQNVDAGNCTAVVTWVAPTAADNCTTISSFTSNYNSGHAFPVGTTTVTYTATDAANNTTTESFDVVITDNEDPVISGMPTNISVNTDAGLCTAAVSWTAPTAADNCGVTSFTSNYSPGDAFNTGAPTTVTYTATDAAGNTVSSSFTVTVTDNQAPQIPVIANITQGVDAGQCNAQVTFADPAATDNCGVTSLAADVPSGSTFALGTTTVTFTAQDAQGLSATRSFTVTVVDDEDPSISGMPANITNQSVDAGLCTAVVTWSAPSASDNCSLSSLSPDIASGSAFPVGTTTVTYTATDAAGNTHEESFTVTVVDDENPVISSTPADITGVSVDAGQCGAAVSWTPPTATDNCAGVVLTSSHDPGDTFPVGTTVVTYNATDAAAVPNVVTTTFNVVVVDDEDPSIANTPNNISVGTDSGVCTADVTWTAPTASDNCSGVVLTSTHNPGDTFNTGTTTVTYTATDAAGNDVSTSFTVTVTDDEVPSIPAIANISQGVDLSACDAVVTFSPPAATDNCGVATLTASPASGSTFPVGTTTVTWTATDAQGLSSTQTFTVTVVDDEDPTISGTPANISSGVDAGNCSAVVSWTPPTAADNCAGVVLTSSHAPGATFPVGVTAVTYVATDAATGTPNVVTDSFTVTVTDDENPVAITQNLTVELNSSGSASITANEVNNGSTDNCGITSMSLDVTSFDCTDLGSNTVQLTVTDAANNSHSATATITVVDNVDPVITLAASNSTVECDGAGNGAAFTAWLNNHGGATATDACGDSPTAGANLTWTHNSSGLSDLCGATGAETVTFRVTDGSGNYAETTATFTIQDTTDPTAVAQNVTVTLDANGIGSTTAAAVNNGSSDVCGSVTLALSKTAFTCADLGSNTVTLTVTDDCGNDATATATVTVQDTTVPTITAPADVQFNTDDASCAVLASGVSLGSATADDNCTYTVTNDAPASFPLGNTTVTWTITDSSNNTATDTQIVTVVDNEFPVISGTPANIIQSTDAGQCNAVVTWTDATSTDNCSTTLTQTHASGATFSVGVTAVTYVSTDGAGNVTTDSFTVTITDDEDPVISGTPDDIVQSVDAGQCNAAVSWTDATSTDNCSTTFSQTHASGSTFAVGVTTVTYTSTDAANNQVTDSFTVTVVDDEDPTITGTPADISVNVDAGKCSAVVSWTPPTAADNCAGVVLTSSHDPGDTFPVGLTTVTYTATDAATGTPNVVTDSFTVTVTDNENPVAITQNLTVELNSSGSASITANEV